MEISDTHGFLARLRWPDGKVTCPVCGSEKVCYLARTRVWRCYASHPRPSFSLKTGTIFEDSPIPLEKWLAAISLVLNGQPDVSSAELSRSLGVTQKTAWFMLFRIRLAMQSPKFKKGEVVDDPSDGVRRLLRVSKVELDRRVREAKLNSPRIYDPHPPGRKRSKNS